MADDTIVFLPPGSIKHFSQNEPLMLGEGIDTVSKRKGVGTEDIYLLSEQKRPKSERKKVKSFKDTPFGSLQGKQLRCLLKTHFGILIPTDMQMKEDPLSDELTRRNICDRVDFS